MREFKLEPKSFGSEKIFGSLTLSWVKHIMVTKNIWLKKDLGLEKIRTKKVQEKKFDTEKLKTNNNFGKKKRSKQYFGKPFRNILDTFQTLFEYVPGTFLMPSKYLPNLQYNLRSTFQHPPYIQDSE